MKPVVHYLEGHKLTQAILIPTGYLSLLPLHSAWTNNPDTPTKRRYALDNIRFTYTPNAVSLQAAQTIAQQTPVTNLLAVENPTGDLRYSTREVAAATATFEHHTLLKKNLADIFPVSDALKNHSVVDFSCHGSANFQEPLESELVMADKKVITLRHLLSLKLQNIRLVLLSACETGIPGLDLPDEVVSLPMGLLQAGVGGVVASLWPVSDLSTMIFADSFL